MQAVTSDTFLRRSTDLPFKIIHGRFYMLRAEGQPDFRGFILVRNEFPHINQYRYVIDSGNLIRALGPKIFDMTQAFAQIVAVHHVDQERYQDNSLYQSLIQRRRDLFESRGINSTYVVTDDYGSDRFYVGTFDPETGRLEHVLKALSVDPEPKDAA